jgi:hypothetical protein
LKRASKFSVACYACHSFTISLLAIYFQGAETWAWSKGDINRLTVAEVRILRSREGETRRGKVNQCRITWYGQPVRMNEERVQKRILNVEIKAKCQDEDQDRNDRLKKMLHRKIGGN